MAISHPLVISMSRHDPELVVPATVTPRERKHLSDIDDQGSLRLQIPILLFYKSCNYLSLTKDPAKVIKDGLSKTLVFYHPFAGRIIEGHNRKLIVDCNGEGILFIEADANVSLEMLGDSIKPPCPYLDELLYNVPGSDGIIGCPLILVQVTRFSCGGFCVGFKINHTMLDAYGLTLFLKALSELIGGASVPSILPVWQRHLLSARSPPRITCMHHEFDAGITNAQEKVLIQHSFFFGDKEMRAIKYQLLNNSPMCCTKFELLIAFLWKCRTIALSLHPDEIVRLTNLINARGKSFALKLPLGYYGNAFISPAAVSKAGLLCSSPLGYAVDLVKKLKDNANKEYLRSVADLMVIKGRPELTKSWNFIISDNRAVAVDEVDFGWGKPVHGGVAQAISDISFGVPVVNNKGEKGTLIAISLPPPAMAKFQEIVYKMTSACIMSSL